MKSAMVGFIGFLVLVVNITTASVLQGAQSEPVTAKGDFYVAPDGTDTNPGTLEKPFATLARARNAIRNKLAAGIRADVLVLIRGGTYPQTETLVFGPKNSGTKKHSITYAAYPGEKVVLSGGRRITGWKKGEGDMWETEIDEVKAGKWYFRQLFVDGQRATRARMPKCDDTKPWWNIKSSTIQAKDPPPNDASPITLSVTGSIKAWKNISDVEFVWVYNHLGSRKRLASVDEAAQTFVLPSPYPVYAPKKSWAGGYQTMLPTAKKPCYFENAIEMLTQPGEWYLDRQSGVLTYLPRRGEDPTRAKIMAPRVQKTLMAVRGTRERSVRNLRFQGIHVEYVDCPLPGAGYFAAWNCQVPVFVRESRSQKQASVTDSVARFIWMDSAVQFEHAHNCSFSDGGIAHAGGIGITLLEGTANIAIVGNEIHDLGGSGIAAGGTVRYRTKSTSVGPLPQKGEYKAYRIVNNHVHHCGIAYYGAAGIDISLTQGAVVAHNLVHDIAYCGLIVYGHVVNDPPFARDNIVEYNHIYNVMKMATDGAGIYVMLPQAGWGCIIRGNLVHDVQHNPFNPRKRSFGVYLDVVSKNYHFKNNVVYNCANGPLYFCGARREDNTWIDNVFQVTGMPPHEVIKASQTSAGLEPAYRCILPK